MAIRDTEFALPICDPILRFDSVGAALAARVSNQRAAEAAPTQQPYDVASTPPSKQSVQRLMFDILSAVRLRVWPFIFVTLRSAKGNAASHLAIIVRT